MPKYDWSSALEELKTREGLKSDSALAKTLGVTPAFVSAIIQGKRNFPRDLLENICRRLGHKDFFRHFRIYQQRHVTIDSLAPSLSAITRVFARAKGKCELCSKKTFLLPDGTPFLEPYIPSLNASQEGDTDLMVALCPNCLEKMRQLNDRSDTLKLLSITNNEELKR